MTTLARARCPRGRLLMLVFAVLALAGSSASGAAAARIQGGESVDVASWGSLAADGDRLVAYVLTDGRLRVVDHAADGASFEVGIPEGCLSDRRSITVGGGQVIARCWVDAPGPSLPTRSVRLDVASRTWHEIPGSDRWTSGNLPHLARVAAVGARWVELDGLDGTTAWADWRSGAVRLDDAPATHGPDLDAEDLFEPMCAPLERPVPDQPLAARAFMPVSYATTALLAFHAGYQLTLQRCGEEAATVLGSASALGLFGAGIVSWSSWATGGPHLFAYLPACRLRIGWSTGQDIGWIAHVRGAVYLLLGDQASGVAYLERIRLPRGCAREPRLAVAAAGRAARRLPASWWRGPRSLGGEIARLPRPGARLVSATRGARLTLRTPPARSVALRDGDALKARAQRLARSGRRWRVRVPRTVDADRIAVVVRGRDGTTSRHLLRVR